MGCNPWIIGAHSGFPEGLLREDLLIGHGVAIVCSRGSFARGQDRDVGFAPSFVKLWSFHHNLQATLADVFVTFGFRKTVQACRVPRLLTPMSEERPLRTLRISTVWLRW